MFQGQGESVVDICLKRKDRTYRPNVSLFRGCASLYMFVLCFTSGGFHETAGLPYCTCKAVCIAVLHILPCIALAEATGESYSQPCSRRYKTVV